jgi:hypothetical protein
MTCSCCGPSSETLERADCPEDGSTGELVKRLTVAAQMRGPVPPKQEFWLCRSPDCSVVYFGSEGTTVTVDQVHEIPEFKAGGSGLACYCFGHLETTIADEVRVSGTSGTVSSVEDQVRAGNCACEVRNPSGKCCLKDLKALVEKTQQARKELA